MGKRTPSPLTGGRISTVSRCSSNVGPEYQGILSLRTATLSPASALMGTHCAAGNSSRSARARKSSCRRRNTSSLQSTRSNLLIATSKFGIPSNEAMCVWRRVCGSKPLVASTRITARSAVEAPVARCVCDDELPSGGAEIPVCDINGDSLFALSSQPIRQQGEINRSSRTVDLAFLHRGELVLVDGFRVVQQSADQCGLAVIYASGGSEAKQFLVDIPVEKIQEAVLEAGVECGQHQKYPSRFLISIDPSSS